MKITSYKELTAYNKGFDLVKGIYKITAVFPKEEMYGLTSQIRRAAVSIPANIAEGYMRGSKEYVQFLKIAMGSAAELETLLTLSRDLKICSDSAFGKLNGLIDEIMKLLRAYIRKMTNKLDASR